VFRLAHITDPHFRGWSASDLLPWRFFGKRAAGGANLLLSRWRKHNMTLLEGLGADLAAQFEAGILDHLVVTGDLGNIGLGSEWQAARHWLERFGPEPRNVTVIPGNHDIYTPDVARSGAFEAAFSGFQKADHRCEGHAYPFVRLRGQHIALIAVNSCVPTGDLGAWGRIGSEQLRRLETLLTEPEFADRKRIVVLHHPPERHRRDEHHNLRDRSDLTALIARTGCELVLHGHDHRDEAAWLPGPKVAVPAIGAGSASYAGPNSARARYNIYEIGDDGVTCITRAHQIGSPHPNGGDSGGFVDVARTKLRAPVVT